MTEKKENEESTQTTQSLPGEKVVTTLRMDKSLLADLHAVAADIKQVSGLNVDRTKLMILACQFLVDSNGAIRKQRIKKQRHPARAMFKRYLP